MPPRIELDDGQVVLPSPAQLDLLEYWEQFWERTYELLAGEPFALIHMGDIVDARHHRTLQLLTGHQDIQARAAVDLLRPHVERAQKTFFIRGTPAHAGESSELEEGIARELKAIRDPRTGSFTHQDLWVEFGPELIHCAHHISSTSSHAYKSSGPMRVMTAMFCEAGEWHQRPPSIIIRGHVHDYIEVKRPNCRVILCPCWQLKTGWIWKKDTVSQPCLGGLIIRQGQWGVHVREQIFHPGRSKTWSLT
jgi:hypothetical protein